MTKISALFSVGFLSASIASCGGDEGSPAGAAGGAGATGGSGSSDGTLTATSTASSTAAGTMGGAATSDTGTSGGTGTTGNQGSGGVGGASASGMGGMNGTNGTSGSGMPTTGSNTTGMASTSAASTSTATTADGAGGATTSTMTTTATSTTGDIDDGDCMTPPAAPPLIGWASEAGGTVGGANATPTVVTSASELNAAAAGNDARVIHVNGSLSGNFSIGSNKTIIGVCGAELRGAVSISGQQNIILRNIKVIGYNCSDSPGDCSGGADAIGVRSSHHIWFDHLEVSDGSDGNLDMTNNSDYITISWTKFFYSTARTDPEQGASGHRFSNLIGGSDSDSGEYRITFHHSWWAENVNQRMPRTRFGDIHVFNNLYTSSGNSYCTNAGFQTRVLVENNIYRGVNNPLSPDANGDMREEGNVFDDTTGNQSDNGGSGFDPPYDYVLDPTDGLDSLLQSEVGPHD